MGNEEKKDKGANQDTSLKTISQDEVKGWGTKSKDWMEEKKIEDRIEEVKKLFKNPLVLTILDEKILSEKQHVFSTDLEKLMMKKNIDIYVEPIYSLTEKLDELEIYCGIGISIRKLEDGGLDFKAVYIPPKYLRYRTMGSTLRAVPGGECPNHK